MQRRLVTLLGIGLILVCFTITPDEMASAQEPCTFTATVEGASLYFAPFTTLQQQARPLIEGVSYPVQRQHDAHFYIAFDHAYGGWVDRRSGILNGDCTQVPVDDTPLSGFPTMCALTSEVDIPFYNLADLTQARASLPPGTYIVTERKQNSLLVQIDHAYGGWVPLDSGQLVGGACDAVYFGTLQRAATLPNARVWSFPDVYSGEVLYELEAGTPVLIVGEMGLGLIRYDTNDTGYWYPIYVSEDRPEGWIWIGRLTWDDVP